RPAASVAAEAEVRSARRTPIGRGIAKALSPSRRQPTRWRFSCCAHYSKQGAAHCRFTSETRHASTRAAACAAPRRCCRAEQRGKNVHLGALLSRANFLGAPKK